SGMGLVYGLIISIPTVGIAGPLFTYASRKMAPAAFTEGGDIQAIGEVNDVKKEETPGCGISVVTSLFPVIVLAISTIDELLQDVWGVSDNLFLDIIQLIGDPTTALLISVLIAVYTMGIARNIPVKQVMGSAEESIKSIGMMLLIIGGGGVFKQVLIDGGV